MVTQDIAKFPQGIQTTSITGFSPIEVNDQLDCQDGIKTNTLQITEGAGDGKFFKSDANGIGSWQAGDPVPTDLNVDSIITKAFTLSTGAAIDKVLKSDVSGNATWADPVADLLVPFIDVDHTTNPNQLTASQTGQMVRMDATSAAVIITLPDAPPDGTQFMFVSTGNNFAFSETIMRGGSSDVIAGMLLNGTNPWTVTQTTPAATGQTSVAHTTSIGNGGGGGEQTVFAHLVYNATGAAWTGIGLLVGFA